MKLLHCRTPTSETQCVFGFLGQPINNQRFVQAPVELLLLERTTHHYIVEPRYNNLLNSPPLQIAGASDWRAREWSNREYTRQLREHIDYSGNTMDAKRAEREWYKEGISRAN